MKFYLKIMYVLKWAFCLLRVWICFWFIEWEFLVKYMDFFVNIIGFYQQGYIFLEQW